MWFYSTKDDFELTQEIIDSFEDAVKAFGFRKMLKYEVSGENLQFLTWWRQYLRSISRLTYSCFWLIIAMRWIFNI